MWNNTVSISNLCLSPTQNQKCEIQKSYDPKVIQLQQKVFTLTLKILFIFENVTSPTPDYLATMGPVRATSASVSHRIVLMSLDPHPHRILGWTMYIR